MSLILDKAVYIEANGLNKTLKQAIVDGNFSGGGSSPDATAAVKGVLKLTNDLGGTADLPTVPALLSKAPLDSPSLTGTPSAPTPAALDNSTKIATTQFVQQAITASVTSPTPFEIFNCQIQIATEAVSASGLVHFRAPVALNISSVAAQIYEKNGVVTGSLTVDIKKNSTPNDVGMVSIFSTLPTFNFATAVDYDSSTGTRSTSAIAVGQYLRLDLTSIPAGFRGTVHVSCYA